MPSADGAAAGGATVLVIDADHAVRDALAASLRAVGFRVATFASVAELLTAGTAWPACVVLDLDDAGGDAGTLLRTLAAAGVRLPAVVTSRRLHRRAGVAALPPDLALVLEKPFGIDELVGLIRRVMAPR